MDDFPTSAVRNSAHSNGNGHGHGKKGSPTGRGPRLGWPGGKRSSRSPEDSSVVDVDAEGEEAEKDPDKEIEGTVGDVVMCVAGEDGEGDAGMHLLEAVYVAEEANGAVSVPMA